ncbi:hypothetical protein [Halogeometricum sp. CBA1124]|uniref:hypothetical protein n=1 Tax=Halogeometricum sp. CBA1124 TaxID=2668071 RepID=UPI0017498D12|nr:hypothetical protein [Halogeometricum sp. CBA1124]
MNGDETRRREPTGRTRRGVLKAAGTGVALLTASGVGAATPGKSNGNGPPTGRSNGNGPPEGLHVECPDGTEQVAKYEFDEESGEFVLDEGTGGFEIEVLAYKDDDPTEPVKIHWTAPRDAGYIHVVGAKYGTETTLRDVDPPMGYSEGTLDLGADSKAISYVTFCSAACAQIDFVVGDEVIEDLNGEQYGARKLRWAYWNTYAGGYYLGDYVDNDGVYEKADEVDEVPDDCTITAGGLTFDDDGRQVTGSFDIDCDEDVAISLVSYRAPCSGALNEQELYDAKSFTGSQVTGESLTVGLPGLSSE